MKFDRKPTPFCYLKKIIPKNIKKIIKKIMPIKGSLGRPITKLEDLTQALSTHEIKVRDKIKIIKIS